MEQNSLAIVNKVANWVVLDDRQADTFCTSANESAEADQLISTLLTYFIEPKRTRSNTQTHIAKTQDTHVEVRAPHRHTEVHCAVLCT